MDAIRVVGFGAMNLDELYRVRSVLSDDETTIEEYQAAPGGSAANTIYGLARLGVSTGFIGAVGDDEAGRMLLQDFKNAGADVSQVKIKTNAKTGRALGLTDRCGRRSLYVTPEANSLLTKEDISLEYIEQASLIHLSSFVDKQQLELQEWLLNNIPRSITVSLAPGAIYARRGLRALTPLLVNAHLLFINQSEVEDLTGTDFRAAARFFLRQGCQIIIVTLGKGMPHRSNKAQLNLKFDEHPKTLPVRPASSPVNSEAKQELFRLASYVTDASNEYVIESQPRNTVDTTGAGDALAAGFLYGFLHRKNLEECGYLGDLVTSFSLKKVGGRAGLPSLNELRRKYRELYLKPL